MSTSKTQKQDQKHQNKKQKVPNVKAKANLTPEEQEKMLSMFDELSNQASIKVLDAKHEIRVFAEEKKITDLKKVPVVHFKNCVGGHYTIATRSVKIFVENCSDCIFDIKAGVLTRTVELWHGGNITLNIGTTIRTLQLDMVQNISVNFAQLSQFKSMIWNQLEGCSINFADSKQHHFDTGFRHMLKTFPDSDYKVDQFIVRLVQDAMRGERCVRLRNGHLSTDREAIDWDRRNMRSRDIYMDKFMKNAGIHLKPEKKKRIRNNDKCPCGTGLRYKKCCAGKKCVTGLAGNQKKIMYHG